MTESAMFERDGERFTPTLASQGPWDPTTLHGGPIAALLARETERADLDAEMRVGRLTIDLLRPVPMHPLMLRHEIVRQGRQIAIVDTTMWWDDRLVARASALFVLTDHKVRSSTRKRIAGEGPPIPGKDFNPRDEFKSAVLEGFEVPGFAQSIELHRIVGDVRGGAPTVAWSCLKLPLVAGEETSPLQLLCCIGDFTSGLGNYVNMLSYTSPNADLSFNLVRYPRGEWIGMDAATVVGDDGIAQSRSRMFDEDGFVGSSTATLVVAPRSEPPSS
jgi:hypothetical protein